MTKVYRVMILVALGAALLRLALGWHYFGFHTGDDVEVLEAGFMRAFGLPFRPWEIRNLLLSDVIVAPVLKVAAALGAGSPDMLVWVATFPFVVLASANTLLVFALGLKWFKNEHAALLAGVLYSFHWLPLGYGSTVYPRTVSTTCVLTGALLLSRRGRGIWRELAAGSLVAVAFAVRYSEVVFLLPLLGAVILRTEPARQRLHGAVALCLGFAATSLLTVGLEDWLVWGRPFSSLLRFAEYTLIERNASSLEVSQPWYWYLWRAPKWLPLAAVPLFFRQQSYRAIRLPLLYASLPLLVLSMIHHKQLRYLQGIIPFVCLAVAAAALGWWGGGRRGATTVLVALCLLLGLPGIMFLQKKSMAAVVAARAIAREPSVTTVALEQSWAYGPGLYLPGRIEVRALPFRPAVRDLASTALGCERVGLYEESVERSPELSRWLEREGFDVTGVFRWGRSRPVIVFGRESDPVRVPRKIE